MPLIFDNRFHDALPGDPETGPRRRQVAGAAWSAVTPTPVAAPTLLAHSAEVAASLGLAPEWMAGPEAAAVLAGNALLPGMAPLATNYGGHQFGHWAGQLGDGRAILLGEAVDAGGGRWELQLKGAGPTPYSRTADGRAVLRSSIREFVCSEAMHHLGVPTTRALSLAATGEAVVRDMFYDGHPRAEPGAVVCRVAPSFLRFGHFELPYARGETELLRRLADFCIWRDFPHLLEDAGGDLDALRAAGAFDAARYGRWFAEVCERTAATVAHWMRVGFVHGVLNTDNMSILGLTIDYGPYGWIEDYDPDWTPNTTDAQGRRYRFGWQPQVVHWNLTRLAQALSPLFEGDPAPLQAGLDRYAQALLDADRRDVAAKLGLREAGEGDVALMRELQGLMRAHAIDMTLWFRGLCGLDPAAPSLVPMEDAFYDTALRGAGAPALEDWLRRLSARQRADGVPDEARRDRMRAANPRYVPRNYLLQQAIDRATAGDAGAVGELLDVLRHPYRDQPGREAFAARRPEWARDRPGCSMLSCSS